MFYSFWCHWKWDFFCHFLFRLFIYRNVIKFFMLTLYPATLLNSFTRSSSFCMASLQFFHIVPYHLHIVTILPLPFQFLFLFLVWLLWLKLPILFWSEVMRMGIFILFQILVGRFSTFPYWVLYWLWVCCKWLLLYWDMFPLFQFW